MTDNVQPSRPSTRRKSVIPPTKANLVQSLLSRPRGVTQTELADATSWQPHSIRAHLSGLRKRGHVLARIPRKDGQNAYHLDAETGSLA